MNELKIEKYLFNKNVLIVTDISIDRTVVKKIFSDLGVPVSNIENAKSLDEALKKIQLIPYQVIVTAYEVKGQVMLPLLQKHLERHPNRVDYFSYIISERNSKAIAARAIEYDVSEVIIKPYNQQDLISKIRNITMDSILMSNELKSFYKVIGLIREKKLVQAQEHIDKYKDIKSDSPNPYYLQGLIYKERGEFDQAVKSWKEGLEKSPDHYRTLYHIFDLLVEMKKFDEAYGFAYKLCSDYPINPDRVPNILRVSLAAGEYENLINFCHLILELETDFKMMTKPIAAALVISARGIISRNDMDQKEMAIKSSIKALDLSEPQSLIAANAFRNLLDLEQYDEVAKRLDAITTEETNQELRDIEMLLTRKTKPAADVFIRAQDFIKKQQYSIVIYSTLIQAAKEMGRPGDALEDLAFEGARQFPEAKEDFLKLVHD